MKKQNKITVIMICFMIFTAIPGFSIIPSSIQTTTNAESVTFQDTEPKTSQFIPRTIRVAIYDEPNITAPLYALGGVPSLDNNYTGLLQLLQGAGYQVDELTCDDIYNHKLMTADYDVFVMVDNLPKTNITDYVKEFWLGGGAILSFDSAISYLCYYGLFIPESLGDQGRYTYFDYTSSLSNNISSRHPTTQDYQVNDKFSCIFVTAYLYWDVLLTTSVGGMVTKLANTDGNNNWATAVALDRDDQGGRIVQLPGRADTIGINMSSLILDAIDWLCPRPKGRIVFDLSHQPRLGVDDWDDLASYPGYYEDWRNELVSRNYMFDKLYPASTGNFTLARLNKYDLLVVVLPDLNYSTSDLNVIPNWVSNGGSLLVMGENPSSSFLAENKQINLLLSDYDLEVNLTYSISNTIDANANPHPTIEGCTDLTLDWRGAVNISGGAYALWEHGGNIHVACQDTGNGRIILVADMNWLTDTKIANQDNRQFGVNAVNWLTASQAKVLILIKDHNNPDPNDNVYRGPVATALNDLGVKFYLTFTCPYLNLSLANNDWDLVIVDEVYNTGVISSYASEIINYMDGGGRLIIYSFSIYYGGPLWDYLGYKYEGTYLLDPPIVYLWDTGHPIFNTPAQYGANNITTSLTPFGTDFVNVTLHNNATGIAGLSETPTVDSNAIILGVNGRAITNTFGLTEYYDDTDDSTYPDALEIWANEIAYMLRPESFSLSSDADSPDDDGMFTLTWTVSDDATEYNIYQPTSLITELTGAETLIAGGVTANSHPLTGLTNGTYYFILESTNNFGNRISNCIEITIEIPPTPPDPDPDPSPGGIPGYELLSLISTMFIATSVIALILIKRNKLKQ